MTHDPDEPLPLTELRTPMPLRDSDFAAVRARVLSEIGRRKERPWVFAFRFAAAMATSVLIVLALFPSKPERVPLRVVRAHVVTAALSGHTAAPGGGNGASHRATAEGSGRHMGHAHRRTIRRTAPAAATAAARIEIHTADPDVRIIWIVNPKENS